MKKIIIITVLLLITKNVVADYRVAKITAYSPEINQTDSTPYEASFGPVAKCTVAVSIDLEVQGFEKHCFIHIYGINKCGGIFQIRDRLNKRKRNQFDIFFFKTPEAVNFGVQEKRVKLLWCE